MNKKQADETSLSGQNKEDYLKRLNYLADYVLTNTITGKGTSFLMGAGAYLGTLGNMEKVMIGLGMWGNIS